jgi:hypothetical protein
VSTIRVSTTVEHDGELHLSNLPLKRGQRVELLIVADSPPDEHPLLTAEQPLASELVGLWEDRDNLDDSSAVVRSLREQAQCRVH